MKHKLPWAVLLAGMLVTVAWSSPAQTRAIDITRSSITVHAFKSGLFSAFGHNHLIQAPIQQGEIRLGAPAGVELVIDSRRLKVLDPDLGADKRAEVQRTMHSDKVLDSERFPQMRFSSTAVEPLSASRWRVRGTLELRGKSRPVVVEVVEQNGSYRGKAKVKQTEFGITPVSVAGGTVKVKDELVIEFEVVPATRSTAAKAGDLP